MKIWAYTLMACGIALSCPTMADTCTVSTNPPANPSGSTSTSCTPSGGLRTQQQDGQGNDVGPTHPLPVTVSGAPSGSSVIGADVVALPGGSAITMFATGHCANGCRISVPVAFCTNPLTTATGTATTGGNECWQPNQSVAMPPTAHAISVFSTSASTASGIGSTVP